MIRFIAIRKWLHRLQVRLAWWCLIRGAGGRLTEQEKWEYRYMMKRGEPMSYAVSLAFAEVEMMFPTKDQPNG